MELLAVHTVILAVAVITITTAMTPRTTSGTSLRVTGTSSSTAGMATSNSNGTTIQTTGSTQITPVTAGNANVTGSMTSMTTSSGLNCSISGQECQNGTCTPAGTCNCHVGYTGVQCETQMVCPDDYCSKNGTHNCTARDIGVYSCGCKPNYAGMRCETFMKCPDDYCFKNGTNNCTVVLGSGVYSCDCKQNYAGKHCEMYDGCLSSPCHNNGTCITVDMYGNYTCECTTGDPSQNCMLNEKNNCYEPPLNTLVSFITCLDGIGSRKVYCTPGYNGSSCRSRIQADDYCVRHGCVNSTYCNPLCNVPECSATNICRNFTAYIELESTRLYDLTECPNKFANGFPDTECESESGLFDGFDTVRTNLKDCSPFFNTICTASFADGRCNHECNNTDCMYDGGDCMDLESSGNDVLPGFTVLTFSQPPMYIRPLETRLSLVTRSVVKLQMSMVSGDYLRVGLEIRGSNFTDVTVASKFFATIIGKIPELVDYVTDVYACDFGKYNNGSESICDHNCSSTCNQSGAVCDWSTGACLYGCLDNYWGEWCQYMCPSQCNGTCIQMEGHCIQCPVGRYGNICELDCDQHCSSSGCHQKSGECTCTTGRYWSTEHSMCKTCSPGCSNITNCAHGTGHCTCRQGYYGASCKDSCSGNCKGGTCSKYGACLVGCISGYYGNMCDQMCPTECQNCSRTGKCEDTGNTCKPGDTGCNKLAGEPQEDNTGVIIAIVIAVLIVLIIILIAVCCWRRKQSGDYILEDEEMESPVKKADTLEVKNNIGLQPVSPYMGRSTDMIDMDEKQEVSVYAGPTTESKTDLRDRNPDGKSANSEDGSSSSSSDNDEKKPVPDEEPPATGEGAPTGRKRSSLKITLSREKNSSADDSMSPKSPHLLVINDKTGEILSPLKIDIPGKSAFEMPETLLKHSMAPLASEEDLLADIGPKTSAKDDEDGEAPLTDDNKPSLMDDNKPEDEEDKKSKRSSSSSSSSSKSSKSSHSEGKKSNKSESGRSSSSDSDSEHEDEKLSEYDENKEPITEM